MVPDSLHQFFNVPVVLSLLTLSVLLTLFMERTRLRRWQEARNAQGNFSAWVRRSDKIFFWLEFLGTFLLVTLLFFGSAVVLRLLTTSSLPLFGTPLLALVIGGLGFAALFGIVMLGSDE